MSTPIKKNTAGLEDILQIIRELPEGDFSDPDYVYAVTRPKDWLPMPTPGDDEMYLLNLIPEGLDGCFTAQIAFSGTCTVEFGNLVDGAFVAKESLMPASGARFYKTVYGDNYGNITADGFRQYFVRVKGICTTINIAYGSNTAYEYGFPYVVDVVAGMSVNITAGNIQSNKLDCATLRYVRYLGNGVPVCNGFSYRGCASLMSVSTQKQAVGNSMNYMFNNCKNLLAISSSFFVPNVPYSHAFHSANMAAVNGKNIKPSDADTMFRDAIGEAIIDGEKIDTSGCKNFWYFAYGTVIRGIRNLDITSMTGPDSMFSSSCIAELTFSGTTTPGGWTINLSSALMSHKALVNMINSLPEALSPATITITGNPGAADLTENEIAVATAKNWTVTI